MAERAVTPIGTLPLVIPRERAVEYVREIERLRSLFDRPGYEATARMERMVRVAHQAFEDANRGDVIADETVCRRIFEQALRDIISDARR